jgi:hypothetical protein
MQTVPRADQKKNMEERDIKNWDDKKGKIIVNMKYLICLFPGHQHCRALAMGA